MEVSPPIITGGGETSGANSPNVKFFNCCKLVKNGDKNMKIAVRPAPTRGQVYDHYLKRF
jgi:hypothetical protein